VRHHEDRQQHVVNRRGLENPRGLPDAFIDYTRCEGDSDCPLEVLARFECILSVMPSRAARWLSVALAAFLLTQPIAFEAFAAASKDASSCCKDKNACCCRKSHGKTSGPALSSRDCGSQCQVSVRNSEPVAAATAPRNADAELQPAISIACARPGWTPSLHSDTALFERPPPFAA